MADLQKMSFLEIKNLPLGKVRGEVYEAALKQAIELEKQASVSFLQTGGLDPLSLTPA